MPEILQQLLQKVRNAWNGLDKGQRGRVIAISGVLIVAITAAIVLMTRTSYTTIHSGLAQKELQAVQTALKAANVPFKVDITAGAVMVDSKRVDDAQKAILGGGGLIQSDIMMDTLLQNIKITHTEKDKERIWDTAVQQKISNKIKQLDNIEDADVLLAIPEKSIFLDNNGQEQKPASAAVNVTPKTELNQKTINAIARLVAASVKDLKVTDVDIIDNSTGVAHKADSATSGLDSPNNQYEMKLLNKKRLESDVTAVFNGTFDAFDAVRVVANPELDFNKQTTQTSKITQPDNLPDGATISKQNISEKATGTGAGSDAGVNSNPSSTTPSAQTGGSNNSTYSKTDDKSNIEWNKEQSQLEKALGALDPAKSSMLVTLMYGKRVADDKGITDDFITNIKKDVSAATGIPVANISVSKYKWNIPPTTAQTTLEKIKALLDAYGVYLILFILTIILIIGLLPRKTKVVEKLAEVEMEAALAGAGGVRYAVPDAEPVPEIDTEERSEIKKQLDKFVQQKPDAVAQLLRNWLADDWD